MRCSAVTESEDSCRAVIDSESRAQATASLDSGRAEVAGITRMHRRSGNESEQSPAHAALLGSERSDGSCPYAYFDYKELGTAAQCRALSD